ADVGETVAYQIKLQNTGTGQASGLVLHLKSMDATTTLQDSTQVWAGGLPAGQSSMGNEWTRFFVNSSGTHRFMCWVVDGAGNELLRRPIDLTSPIQAKNVTPIGNANDITFVW